MFWGVRSGIRGLKKKRIILENEKAVCYSTETEYFRKRAAKMWFLASSLGFLIGGSSYVL
jgi:hypothetical protein